MNRNETVNRRAGAGRESPRPGDESRINRFLRDIFQFAEEPLLRADFFREMTNRLVDIFQCARADIWIMEEREDGKINHAAQEKGRYELDTSPLPPEAYDSLSSLVSRGDAPAPVFSSLDGQLRSIIPTIGRDESGEREDCRWIPLGGGSRSAGVIRLVAPRVGASERELEQLGTILGFAVDHRRCTLRLRERVKELTCLYGIAHVAERPRTALEEMLAEIVRLLPAAWLYPETATARIILDHVEFALPDFRQGAHTQSADIVVNGLRRGSVEVVYLEPKPEVDEGAFLYEERWLINTIANELALIIRRGQAEDEDKNRMLNQIRHADRLATFGLLAAGIAHEINEPLGNILGFAQLAKKEHRITEQLERDVDKIIAATLRAREVMQKLMLFARQMPPKKIRVKLNDIVREGIYFLEGRCAQEGITLALDLAPSLPAITADPAQLYQAIINLVVNAIQAMPEGGTLTIETRMDEQRIILVIADTGIGMDEETMKQIFIPFFTTKDVGEGTGLGLSVAHGIVTAHGGAINVSSRPGSGSSFTIILPRYPDQRVRE